MSSLFEERIEKITEAIENFNNIKDLGNDKKALVAYISANLHKIGTTQYEGSTRALLMLIAALGILSSSDDPGAISSAKRLVSVAFSLNRKKANIK